MSTKKAAKPAPTIGLDDPELAGKSAAPSIVTPPSKSATGDPGEDRITAFGADAYTWNGQPIQGMTSGRWGVFLEMRASVTSIDLLDSMLGDGWFIDSLRILYFCGTPPETWRPFRKDPMAWQEEIERWGSEQVAPGDRLELEALAFEIYKDSRVNRHDIAPAAKGAGDAGK